MENKAQKKVLIIVGILLVIIAVLAYTLSMFIPSNDEPNTPSIPEEPTVPEDEFNTEIVLLEDEALFFGVQQVINDYYSYLIEENTQELLDVLDPLYIDENQIMANNIYSILNIDFDSASYVAKEVYYNPDSSVTYYFVSGDLTTNSFIGDEYEFQENISFLIIVDEGSNYYVLRPIDVDNLLDYVENYDLVERDINQGGRFSAVDISLENKLSTYLGMFINYLIYNSEEAYSLLTANTRGEYASYDDFASQVLNIYEMLSTRIFSYSSREDDGVMIYEIIDDNQNNITIYEEGINDFQISY